MSDSTMTVSSKYTQDLSVQIVFFTFSCKWFLCFYFWAVIWSYIVDLFAALHELASASAHTLLKLVSSVRALLKPYGDTLSNTLYYVVCVCSPHNGRSNWLILGNYSPAIILKQSKKTYNRLPLNLEPRTCCINRVIARSIRQYFG